MRQSLSNLTARIAIAAAGLVAVVKDAWLATATGPAVKYRPEAHYMRGPGPKWRAKHAQLSATSAAQR